MIDALSYVIQRFKTISIGDKSKFFFEFLHDFWSQALFRCTSRRTWSMHWSRQDEYLQWVYWIGNKQPVSECWGNWEDQVYFLSESYFCSLSGTSNCCDSQELVASSASYFWTMVFIGILFSLRQILFDASTLMNGANGELTSWILQSYSQTQQCFYDCDVEGKVRSSSNEM